MNVTGTVKDVSGEPLEFAPVWESDVTGKKTGLGATTNEHGQYTLQHSGQGYVSSSYVGYTKQVKPVSGTVNFAMESFIAELPEVNIEAKRGLARIQIIGIALLALGVGAIIVDRVRAARA